MQSLVKCITIITMLLQTSVACHAFCLCDLQSHHEKTTDLDSHSHSHHHHDDNNHKTPLEDDDCCCNSVHCNFVVSPIARIVTCGDCIETYLKRVISIPSTSSFPPHCISYALCNSYAATIRLRAEIWIL